MKKSVSSLLVMVFSIILSGTLMTSCKKENKSVDETPVVEVNSVELNVTSMTLYVGDMIQLKATIVPAEAVDATISWSSSNDAIATVDDKGNVTAISVGDVEITATSGDYDATCEVTVTKSKVYGVGSSSVGFVYKAMLWIDGEPTYLTDGTYNAEAMGMCVSGEDVYVVGYEDQTPNRVAKLWKNGIGTDLTDGTYDAQAMDVYVDGSDIYIVFDEKNESNKWTVKLWHNGTITEITNGTNYAWGYAITVYEGDVYIAGYENDGSYKAKYWKNGVATLLAPDKLYSEASSIVVSDGEIYACGYQEMMGTMWHNGVATELTDGEDNGRCLSMYVDGDDVFVCGYDTNVEGYSVGKCWKNGTLLYNTDGLDDDSYNSVLVFKGDVYVGGWSYLDGNTVACYWVNGEQYFVKETEGHSYIYDIFVQ